MSLCSAHLHAYALSCDVQHGCVCVLRGVLAAWLRATVAANARGIGAGTPAATPTTGAPAAAPPPTPSGASDSGAAGASPAIAALRLRVLSPLVAHAQRYGTAIHVALNACDAMLFLHQACPDASLVSAAFGPVASTGERLCHQLMRHAVAAATATSAVQAQGRRGAGAHDLLVQGQVERDAARLHGALMRKLQALAAAFRKHA